MTTGDLGECSLDTKEDEVGTLRCTVGKEARAPGNLPHGLEQTLDLESEFLGSNPNPVINSCFHVPKVL